MHGACCRCWGAPPGTTRRCTDRPLCPAHRHFRGRWTCGGGWQPSSNRATTPLQQNGAIACFCGQQGASCAVFSNTRVASVCQQMLCCVLLGFIEYHMSVTISHVLPCWCCGEWLMTPQPRIPAGMQWQQGTTQTPCGPAARGWRPRLSLCSTATEPPRCMLQGTLRRRSPTVGGQRRCAPLTPRCEGCLAVS